MKYRIVENGVGDFIIQERYNFFSKWYDIFPYCMDLNQAIERLNDKKEEEIKRKLRNKEEEIKRKLINKIVKVYYLYGKED